MRLPVRQPVAGGSRRRQRVAASLVARLFGVALVTAAAAAMYWITGADDFDVDVHAVGISGLAITAEADVRARLGIQPLFPQNAFHLRASTMAEEIQSLPSVERADIVIALPNRVEVHVVERQPLLSWRIGASALAVDAEGLLIAVENPPTALPQVLDRRLASQDLAVGDRIGAIDLAAARLLLTIKPADLGSRASALELSVGDEEGFVLSADLPAWRAVFGFYSANQLKPDERVPRQRQCLASILAANGEERLEAVYLAVTGDTCGSYRDRPTFGARFFQNVRWPAT